MKTIPFYLLLIMTFGLAGLEKLIAGSTPTWFLEQFKGSLLDLFPGALNLAFLLITLLEITTALLLLVGLAKREFGAILGKHQRFLKSGIILAQLTFVALGFGQRLTHKFDSAASLFLLAAITFIAGQMALAEE